MKVSLEQEKQWVINLRKGGEARREAVSDIYDVMSTGFRWYFLSRSPEGAAKADELVQDVFVKLLLNVDSYTGEGRFTAWLWGITKNIHKDYYRRYKKISFPSLDEVKGEDLHEKLENKTKQDVFLCVDQVLTEFEEKHPDRAYALRLITQYGWKIEDVATFLGRTIGATREYLSQCRKKVKPFLEQCFELLEG